MNLTDQSYPTINQSWSLLFITIGFALGAAIVIGIPTVLLPKAISENEIVASLIELIGYILMLGGAILFARAKRKKQGPNGPLWRPFHSHKGILILVVLLTPLVGIILDPINDVMPSPDWFNELMLKMVRPNFISFIAIAIAPAILEELLCRGVMLDGMLKNYSPAKAIFFSSLFFGILHLNPWQAVFGMLIGIYLGWVYYRTRSLWPCFLIHATNNATSFFFTLYMPKDVATFNMWLGTNNFLILFFIAVILFCAGIWSLNKLSGKGLKAPHEGIVRL